jgi:predicted DCC family thiol-disulfide oxidoreductase YuxK
MNTNMTTIYFDGLCQLCSREIKHYRKLPGSDGLIFVDITSPAFDAQKAGLDPMRVHREMHVRRADGSLAIGVDAFIAIWETLPRYHLAARLGKKALPHAVLAAGYFVFARLRPYLPRKKADCSASPYCEVAKK